MCDDDDDDVTQLMVLEDAEQFLEKDSHTSSSKIFKVRQRNSLRKKAPKSEKKKSPSPQTQLSSASHLLLAAPHPEESSSPAGSPASACLSGAAQAGRPTAAAAPPQRHIGDNESSETLALIVHESTHTHMLTHPKRQKSHSSIM